ncbi:MAG: peptidoglycan binding domain-containing protein, partial [Actinomycetota bacterium]
MARGSHAPARRRRAIAVVAIVAGILVLAAGGAAYSAYRYEQARADRILPGVTIAGIDVGGMTKAEAVDAVRSDALITLQQSIKLRASGRSWSVTLEELGQRSRAVGAVNQALAVGRTMGTFSRFWHRFNDEPVGQEVELDFAGDGRVDSVLRGIAKDIAVKPVDADIMFADGQVVFQRPKPGRALDFVEARAALKNALAARSASRVALPVLKVQPKVTERKMSRTIVVRVDENKLYLYDGFDVIRTW